MESCLYEGWVTHRRHAPVRHQFRRRLFMVYLDLSELATVFRGRWLWATTRPTLAWFRRADHFGDPAVPLDTAVRALVEQRTGIRPAGPVRLLTHLRYLGYVFNPVSLYYCFDPTGRHVQAIVADVNNTPWGERHQYVLAAPAAASTRFTLTKAFHVSPFMPMDIDYDWRFTTPAHDLSVHMVNTQREATIFDATLTLRRRPIDSGSLAGVLVRYPAMTMVVIMGIYWEAFRLWRKHVPFHAHPRHAGADEVTASPRATS